MFTKAALVVVGLLAIGCGRGDRPLTVEPAREIPAPAHAQDAVDAIVSALGMIRAPEVHWYGGAGLDADCEGTAWHPVDEPSICVGGEEKFGVLLVAYPDGSSIRRTQLAHEMTHFYGELTGNDDQGHDRQDLWFAGGVIERANTAIDGL